MPLPRLQLFELEDQGWLPDVVRDLATDYLHFVEHRFGLHRHALPALERVIDQTSVDCIVDLCSGGAGPIPDVVRDLGASGRTVRAVLTDLYPNLRAFEDVRRSTEGRVTYRDTPVDARRVPHELKGLRTFFNAFHHFAPDDATEILRSAGEAGQPIAIVEVSERRITAIVPLFLTPLFVWLATPFIRPVSWSRLLLTYLLPAVPLTCLWDGLVSQLRAYRPDELLELGRQAVPSGFHWEAGTDRAPGAPGRITYLVGWPTGTASWASPRAAPGP